MMLKTLVNNGMKYQISTGEFTGFLPYILLQSRPNCSSIRRTGVLPFDPGNQHGSPLKQHLGLKEILRE